MNCIGFNNLLLNRTNVLFVLFLIRSDAVVDNINPLIENE